MPKKKQNTNKDRLSPLIDSPQDREKLISEPTEIILPGVEDIPGQENIIPPSIGELRDVTASSSDEEGDAVFEDNLTNEMNQDSDSNVSRIEKRDLSITANDMPGDDENLRDASLDSTDEEGAPLNEGSFGKNVTPDDLDVPGVKQDDENEKIGEEDEENNEYSISGTEDPPEDDF
jgi:hypothetical protein